MKRRKTVRRTRRHRNPETRTFGGSKRHTRESTLKRRQLNALRIDVTTQSDGTAEVVFEFNNGDATIVTAPNTWVALYWLDASYRGPGYSSRRVGRKREKPQLFVNGVNGRAARDETAYYVSLRLLNEYKPFDDKTSDGWVLYAVSVAFVQAWVSVLMDDPSTAAEAYGLLLEDPGQGAPAGARYKAVMEAINKAVDGFGIEYVRSPEGVAGPFWQDTVAIYINYGSMYSQTIIYETESDQFVSGSIGDWIERYEAEGGTIR